MMKTQSVYLEMERMISSEGLIWIVDSSLKITRFSINNQVISFSKWNVLPFLSNFSNCLPMVIQKYFFIKLSIRSIPNSSFVLLSLNSFFPSIGLPIFFIYQFSYPLIKSLLILLINDTAHLISLVIIQ